MARLSQRASDVPQRFEFHYASITSVFPPLAHARMHGMAQPLGFRVPVEYVGRSSPSDQTASVRHATLLAGLQCRTLPLKHLTLPTFPL